ncbi:glycoside hydrolase family 127 protein [Paenibacillus tritici]|uniref:Glycoside hydrolase family 127 protein n=1 Tax=Paenibacillus tritici TaxID=1873425 RepID=A0ABX2DTQ6_9BACL|nr:glycoside hydrolase family 127 protein [Paenibacillus tritici]
MFKNFGLDEVTLTDHDFASRRQLVKKYIAEFDLNRLLHTFKLNAGLPSDAEPLGGWESPESGLRGHFAGHYLSACAKFAYGDQDQALRRKACEIVDIMEACAKPNGYLSAFEEEKLDILEAEEDRKVWAPYYTLHKILQGLVDCHLYLHSPKALVLARNLAYYVKRRMDKLSHWKKDGILRCTKVNPANEFGGMGDTLYTLYEATGDRQILALANQFDRPYLLHPLETGADVLENLHANTHLPMVLAAMHRYNISGEDKYQAAAIHFYEYLQGRTLANGNNSSKATDYIPGGVSERSEHWGAYGDLGDALTGGESESCCAHNTERILERLLEWSGSVEYLDHLESLKYNAILNSASRSTGLSQYHQPLGSGVSKTFSGPYDTFWCCTASGVEAMSELQKNIWFRSGEALLLNAFISSTLDWKEKNLQIIQESRFPDGLLSTLQIKAAGPAAFKLILKEQAVAAVTINSVPQVLQRENGYCAIERVFADQDLIEIEIAAALHQVPLPGAEHLAAVKYGNVLLARVGQAQQASFVPLFRVEEEEYTVYLDVEGHEGRDRPFSRAQDGSAAYAD